MDDEVDRILFGFQSQACGSVADLLHRMAFEMKSACSQTQTRQVEKLTAWFPVPSRQFESHEESRSNAAPLHVSVSPHESGDRYREGDRPARETEHGRLLGVDGVHSTYIWPAARSRA